MTSLPTLAMEMPQGPFSVVVADPPWLFASNSDAEPGRNPRRHYPCQPTDDIARMPIGEVAGPDASLFLWAISPMLVEAIEVLQAWGFTYKSNIVWNKGVRGLGYWCRSEHEILLIGRRGSGPLPANRTTLGSIINEKRREHSRKPEAFYSMIDTGYPNARILELFARKERGANWSAWGNQTDLFNDVEAVA